MNHWTASCLYQMISTFRCYAGEMQLGISNTDCVPENAHVICGDELSMVVRYMGQYFLDTALTKLASALGIKSSFMRVQA
jgi:hypothetical protein